MSLHDNTATTGLASGIIEGMTIHAAFGFQHGNILYLIKEERSREISLKI